MVRGNVVKFLLILHGKEIFKARILNDMTEEDRVPSTVSEIIRT